MKNLYFLFLKDQGSILVGFCLFLIFSCEQLNNNEELSPEELSQVSATPWESIIGEIISNKSVIVEANGNIQEAINEAQSGEVIYIAPGLYSERLSINKLDLKLIGIDNDLGEKVVIQDPDDDLNPIQILDGEKSVELINIVVKNGNGEELFKAPVSSSNARKPHRYFKMKREKVKNGVAHYKFEIGMGPGEFDVVRIHRVVKEKSKFRPVKTKGEIFMIHGSGQDFDDIFYTAGAVNNINPMTSSPVYLASKGIDVWGIDLGWTLVPIATNDFGFMENWGVEKDIEHTLAAMSIARLIRGMTGQGFGQLNLLGFSYGAVVAYGAAGLETQQHPILQDIKGIIPVDQAFKYAASDTAYIEGACKRANSAKDSLNKGVYHNAGGVGSIFIGNLADSDPDEETPIPNFKPFTNYQVPIFIGANLYLTGNPPAPFWHFLAGNGETPVDVATEFLYTDPYRWIELFKSLAPYQPYQLNYDVSSCACDQNDVSFDDYLGEIKVPIYYLGAGGGTGSYGEFSTTKTASTDITIDIIATGCTRHKDFGHADLFMAENAAQEVWKKLYLWLLNHNSDMVI